MVAIEVRQKNKAGMIRLGINWTNKNSLLA